MSTDDLGGYTGFDVIRVKNGNREVIAQSVATEVPCTIVVNGCEIATLMCTPTYLREFAVGYLFTSAMINEAGEVQKFYCDSTKWRIDVETTTPVDTALLDKRIYTSGCLRRGDFSHGNREFGQQQLRRKLQCQWRHQRHGAGQPDQDSGRAAYPLASNSGNLAKTGYSFVGWNTQASGSGTEYAQGASYTANASVTLYAKWSDRLLAWWKFDETSGTSAADSSGNGNAGTLSSFPASPWAAGKIGNCLTFDGTDDFVVKDPLSASIAGECTASVWMKKSGASAGAQRLFDVAVSAGAGLNVCVAATSGNVIMLTQGGLTAQLNTTTSVTEGNWHHIAATRSGSAPYTFKIYVDGVLRATDSAANNTLPALTRLFAGSKRGTQERFGGQLDDLRVYGRVLSATEIQALASSAAPPTLTIARQGTQVEISWTPAGGRLEREQKYLN